MILISEIAKTNICNQFDRPAAIAPVFAIEKAKMAKDILNNKGFAIGISAYGTFAPALRFLQVEEGKQVHVTSLTYLQLLLLYITIFTNGKIKK